MALFEFMMMDHHIRSLVLRRTSGAQLRQSMTSRGMTSLWQVGWKRALTGDIGLQELLRVLNPELLEMFGLGSGGSQPHGPKKS